MLEKKYQVFISSTYKDLIEERQKAVEAILNAGHIPAGMELFHAGDETQKELISEWIEDSDIYVLILGGRYGSIDTDGMGYTHWEYERAKELGKPFFSLVLTENYLNNKVLAGKLQATDLSYHDSKLVDFRNEVKTKIVSNIDNIDQIEAEVIKSINRIVKKREKDLEGWIKGSSLNELEGLREENKTLSTELMDRQSEVIGIQKELSGIKDNFIGPVSFEIVKKELSEKLLDYQYIEELFGKIDITEVKDDVAGNKKYFWKNINNRSYQKYSVLQCLLDFEGSLLSGGMTIYDINLDIFINEKIVSEWFKFLLVEREHVPSQNRSFGSMPMFTPAYERIKITDAGRKFLLLLKMKNN